MSVDPVEVTRTLFEESIQAHRRFVDGGLDRVVTAADAIGRAFGAGKKLLAFGNGGSASDAQHLVSELVGRFEVERAGLAAVALTADTNILTALSNDYGYGQVFARQINALGAAGDVAFGISTSGASANVEAALAAARARGLVTIALTGRGGGRMGAEADIHLNVSESSTARVQEVHRTVLHAICTLIDQRTIEIGQGPRAKGPSARART